MERIGPYVIEESLGKGGGSLVYKGFNQTIRQYAVIKALNLEGNASPEIQKLLTLEVQMQACLQHSNLAAVYSLTGDQDDLFVVMEYVKGTTLDICRARADFNSPRLLSDALALFEQLLAALDYIHDRGIFHRNIKPSNIIINNSHLTLLDFGIARLKTIASQASSGITLGSPGYMSPEEIQSQQIDRRADIYSAAAVLFEALTGRGLFPGKEGLEQLRCHLTETPPALKILIPDIPAGISDAIAIALEKDPRLRFPTAGDFLRALQEGLAGFLPVRVTPTSGKPAAESLTDTNAPHLPVTAPSLPSLRNRPLWHQGTFLALLILGTLLAFGLWKTWYPSTSLAQTDANLMTRSSVQPEPLEKATSTPTITGEKILRDETSPIPTPPKRLRPTRAEVAQVPTVVAKPDPIQVRQEEVEKLRDEVLTGIRTVKSDITAQSLESAQEQLDLLIGKIQKFPDELRKEGEEILSLRKEVNGALVAQQATVRKYELQHAAWETRLSEIQTLISQGSFPEAEKLAQYLSQEQDIPESLAARARQLQSKAKEAIKDAFKDTTLGPTKNILRKPPG